MTLMVLVVGTTDLIVVMVLNQEPVNRFYQLTVKTIHHTITEQTLTLCRTFDLALQH